jgi:hypothetical protein
LFSTYLELGISHILDINAYDHLLFIIVLTAPFTLKYWKKVVIMATAFTLGHSITLILSTFDLVRFPTSIIEFLIPCTILATSIYNLLRKENELQGKKLILSYNMAAFFGLIHGMGFSNFLRASLLPGEENSLFIQLLAFNIGIEVSQIIIILILLILYWVLNTLVRLNHTLWLRILSIFGIIVSCYLMFQTWPM